MENQTLEFYGTHIENENSILDVAEEEPKLKKQKTKKQEIEEQIFSSEKNQGDKKLRDELIIQTYGCDEKTLIQKNQENKLIYKDNLLAQKAHMNFTENELKCINYCITKLKDNKTIEIEFPLREILTFFSKYGKTDYIIMQQALKNIRDKSVWWQMENKKVLFAFFNEVEINEDTKIVNINFSKYIFRLIKNNKTKFYTHYLYYTSILSGKYTILFYELCKSWQSVGHFIFNIEDIKEKWNISKSIQTGDFKHRIIDYAIKQFNEKTDIKVSIIKTYKTKTRKITAYEFKIEINARAIQKNTDDFREELKEQKRKREL
jgi:plasmid replication initiation protein